jgi:thiol-disulfide isomerase/thioredoxin
VAAREASSGLRSLALAAAVVAAGFALLWWSARGGGESTPERFVQDAAPEQVTPPDRPPRDPPRRQVQPGDKAPVLALPDLSGTMRPLLSYRGQVVVLNVWASWCPPCIKEMPSLERLHAAAPQGVVVVTVSVDEDLAEAKRLVQKLGLTFPVMLDPGGERLATWGTVKYPETWIIGRDGVVLDRVIGARDWSSPDVLATLTRP